MFKNNRILVVIPARGGSKGIPRKNIRLLNNKPLIYYSINIAKSSEYVDDVLVTTDDSEIALLAEKFGVNVIKRSEELSGDEVPLDPVIYDAMIKQERTTHREYDIIITIQPTSPLLKTDTLNKAIQKFENSNIDSVLSVVDDRHLSWSYDEINKSYLPNYVERKNRQYLPKNFRETGAILATRRNFVLKDSRLGTNLDLIEVSRDESVDIDNYEDWWIAENYLQKKKIAIVVNAYDEIGTGHVYRCLSIASKLIFHEVLFLLAKEHQLGINIINNYNYPFKLYDGKDELLKLIDDYHPQIVINDFLDTNEKYMTTLKNNEYFVVNFEDIGPGSKKADLVFNALYEGADLNNNNSYYGYKYYILKDEFYFQPKKIITKNVDNILITFGGTDPNNFTEKVIDSILSTNYKGNINVILGLGYKNFEKIISKYESNPIVQIYRNVSNISEFMFKADIIFTSAGRTMYEICSIGVPTICLCQNERELTHVFANENNGFINMGLGINVTKQDIMDNFINLVNNDKLRIEMNQKMLSKNLKNGFNNIWTIISNRYDEITDQE